jgi:hypothetical protein
VEGKEAVESREGSHYLRTRGSRSEDELLCGEADREEEAERQENPSDHFMRQWWSAALFCSVLLFYWLEIKSLREMDAMAGS